MRNVTAVPDTFRVRGNLLPHSWLKQALEKSNLSQADLTRALNERFGLALDKRAMSEMVHGKRKISLNEALAIAHVTGVSLPGGHFAKTTPVVGVLKAGTKTIMFYEDLTGPLEYVERPAGAGPSSVAVTVEGDAMWPMARAGWLVYYDDLKLSPREECMAQPCVVQIHDGDCVIRDITHGTKPGLYTLLAVNGPPIENVRIKWAQPVLAIIPRQ